MTMVKKVLIVDDDIQVREDLKLPLLMRGYKVLEASNGQEALNIARTERPQVILQDILISKLDGFRVSRLIKFDSRLKHIIVVAITQLARQETQEEARRMGFDYFVTKPLDPERIADKVDQIFTEIQTQEEKQE